MTQTLSEDDGEPSNKHAILWLTVLALLALLFSPAFAKESDNPPPVATLQGVHCEEVEIHPDLAVICQCESGGYPHKDETGKLLSGFVDSYDKGECQINTRYHGEAMVEMGLDIEDNRDYYTYAAWLFEKEGRQPWMASRACWHPIIGD